VGDVVIESGAQTRRDLALDAAQGFDYRALRRRRV